jgi:hypothetical protein
MYPGRAGKYSITNVNATMVSISETMTSCVSNIRTGRIANGAIITQNTVNSFKFMHANVRCS